MKKLGLPKRILWIWETICYSCLVGCVIKLISVGVKDEWIALLCSPTAIFMLCFGEFIYSDKIKWEKYNTHEWVVPLVILIGLGIHEFFKKSLLWILVFGVLITYILLIIVAFTTKNKKTN